MMNDIGAVQGGGEHQIVPVQTLITSGATIVVKKEKDEVAYEALLQEMHKADDLAETHSVLVTISGAAFAFAATQLENPKVVYCVAVFGLLVDT